MNRPVRLGAVSYLNVRPLVYRLDERPDVSLRFDVPSECARLLAAGEIDLGMIPSIAYLDRPGDHVIPGVCIGSEGPVASVALFSRKPIRDVLTVALDTSSRTSAILIRILCFRRFGIAPSFIPHDPDLSSMLAVADAALLIGDAALFAEPRAHRAEKIDLGQVWTDLTGLPFVWAFWAGRPAAGDPETARLLYSAAEDGMAHADVIAAEYCRSDPGRTPIAARYLSENLAFRLTPRALEGLRTYYREALHLGLTTGAADLVFFESEGSDRGQTTVNDPTVV